jgi:hypothetical protein
MRILLAAAIVLLLGSPCVAELKDYSGSRPNYNPGPFKGGIQTDEGYRGYSGLRGYRGFTGDHPSKRSK